MSVKTSRHFTKLKIVINYFAFSFFCQTLIYQISNPVKDHLFRMKLTWNPTVHSLIIYQEELCFVTARWEKPLIFLLRVEKGYIWVSWILPSPLLPRVCAICNLYGPLFHIFENCVDLAQIGIILSWVQHLFISHT